MQLCCMAAYVVAFLSTVALSACRTVSRLLLGSLGALVLLIVGAGLATTLRPIRRSTAIPMSCSRHGRTSCKGGLLPFFLLPNLGLSRAPPNGDWLQAISPRTTHVQGSRQKTPRSGGAVLTPGVSCSDVPASGIKQHAHHGSRDCLQHLPQGRRQQTERSQGCCSTLGVQQVPAHHCQCAQHAPGTAPVCLPTNMQMRGELHESKSL